ncbi:hypothetical protein HanPSC8_Chr15g0649991 [Helianthus annuus]|nr:hypothetical protein HanPSC8_Chr15g0649991 [Helianthus annuus]
MVSRATWAEVCAAFWDHTPSSPPVQCCTMRNASGSCCRGSREVPVLKIGDQDKWRSWDSCLRPLIGAT